MGGRSIACLERARPQPARLPPRPPDRGRLRRRPVPLRLRRPPDLGRAHRPAHRAVDDRGAAHVPGRQRSVDRAAVPCRRRGRLRTAARLEARRRLPVRAGAVLARRAARVAVADRVRRTGLRGHHGRAECRDGAARSAPTSSSSRFPMCGWRRSNVIRPPGVALACDLVEGVRESGAFDGVHLIPVSKYREVAARLERKPEAAEPRGGPRRLERLRRRRGSARCRCRGRSAAPCRGGRRSRRRRARSWCRSRSRGCTPIGVGEEP